MMRVQAAAYLVDPVSGLRYPIDRPRWCSDAGAPLRIAGASGLRRENIDRSLRSLWRYAQALPVPVDRPISLGEGLTPLVSKSVGELEASFKLEWFSPSASFKDRGYSVMLSMLRAQGVAEVLTDSSGNGGASLACYAAAGDLNATVVAPATTSSAKITQIRSYGATVELIDGSRSAVAQAARDLASHIFYASHNWHPFFLEGVKTLAYELWEDLGFRAPDNVIVPAGGGSLILGLDQGFRELQSLGEIDQLPRLFAVQPQNCAPITARFHGEAAPDIRPTVAEGAAIAEPVRASEVVEAVRRSGGACLAASEDQIIRALLDSAAAGMFCEPTSACAVAGLRQVRETGAVTPQQTTVVVLTGTGVKAVKAVTEHIAGA